jgi:hypothetical protein
LVLAALAAFAVSLAAGLYVLLPKTTLLFSLEGSVLYEAFLPFREDMDEIYRRLVYDLERFWEVNDRRLQRLFLAFRVSTIALGIEVALLLTAATTRLV